MAVSRAKVKAVRIHAVFLVAMYLSAAVARAAAIGKYAPSFGMVMIMQVIRQAITIVWCVFFGIYIFGVRENEFFFGQQKGYRYFALGFFFTLMAVIQLGEPILSVLYAGSSGIEAALSKRENIMTREIPGYVEFPLDPFVVFLLSIATLLHGFITGLFLIIISYLFKNIENI